MSNEFKVGDKVIQTDKSEYLPNGFEHEVGEVVRIQEGEFPYRVVFPSWNTKRDLSFAPEELRLAEPPREGFRVGDKVRQIQPAFPYGLTWAGFRFEGAVGEIVGIIPGLPLGVEHYIQVRFADEEGRHYWPYAEDELELVSEPVGDPLTAHAAAEKAYSEHRPDCTHTLPGELCPVRLLRDIAYTRFTKSVHPEARKS